VFLRRTPIFALAEPLEARRLLSATASLDGGVLTVAGTDAADTLRVTPATALAQNTTLRIEFNRAPLGTFENVTEVRILGLGGNDHLIASPGVNVPVLLDGGDGDDTLVASASRVTAVGGNGSDAFWAARRALLATPDLSPAEASRKVNRLPETFSRINVPPATAGGELMAGSTLDGISGSVSDAWKSTTKAVAKVTKSVRETLREPKLTRAASGYVDFTGKPLFSEAGPSPDDISQGLLNNCFLMVSLGGVASLDPSLLRQTITDLGDGTFAVRLMRGRTPVYYRVDADLPKLEGSTAQLAYADLGRDDALWVPLVEKAFAMSRGGSYAKLDRGGWMGDVFKALGLTTKTVGLGAALAGGPTGLLTSIALQMAADKIVTFGTRSKLPDGSPLAPNHAYLVESVLRDESGTPIGLQLRNPWNFDGPNGDGRLTLTAESAARGLTALSIGAL
jgi:hypothetical protein